MTISKQRLLVLLLCLGMAKAAVYNAKCSNNKECTAIYNELYECHNGGCVRASFDYSLKEIAGFFVVVLLSTVTNAGGVGAGTVIIPVFMFFYGFVSSDAIPLSRVTIFAGSLVNYLLNWTHRDPHHKNRFLINYRLSSVMAPLLLAGTQVGVLLAKFLPAAFVTLILVAYLISSAHKMFLRACKDSEKERIAVEEEKAKQEEEAEKILERTLEDESRERSQFVLQKKQRLNLEKNKKDISKRSFLTDSMDSIKTTETSQSIDVSEDNFDVDNEYDQKEDEAQLQIVSREEKFDTHGFKYFQEIEQEIEKVKTLSLYQLFKQDALNMAFILLSLCGLVFSSLSRGSEASPSVIHIKSCGLSSWLILALTQVLAICAAIGCYYLNLKGFNEEDIEMPTRAEALERHATRKKLLYASYSTGILAGLLGVGGGMVLGLYMLSLGMDAYVSTALSTFIVLITSGATTFQFIVAGAIHLRHAGMFMLMSLIGSIIGNLALKALLKRYKRPSMLVWILFGVLCLAIAVLPIEMGINIARKNVSAIAFGKLC